MKSFQTFLVEAAASEDKLKHLEHAEDHPINAGAEGYQHAVKTLHAVHNAMQGKPSDAHITTKYDGSPSIVFGHHPDTGKFFVASKSAFNKNPKLNYTPEDIENNHGHAPGLVDKLKQSLKHLPKVAPDKGIYQGDVMHSGNKDVKKVGDEYHFKPNTITYTAKQGSPEGRKIAASKFGLVVHTQYNGKDFESMKANFKPNHKAFKEHSDVHLITPEVDSKNAHYDKKTVKKFEDSMAAAEQAHQKLSKGGYDKLASHSDNLKTYINKTVRDQEEPSVEGYKKHISDRGAKDIEKLKTAKGKAARQAAHDMSMKQIGQHSEHIKNMLDLHKHLQTAKDTLVHALEPAVKGAFGTKINDKESKSEGSVVTINGRPTKLVDRAEFSRANFAARPRPGDEQKKEEPKKEEKSDGKHGVLVFGRMNPPTAGHIKVAEKMHEVAKQHDAVHRLVVSHSQDEKKNPLSSEQKIKHAKRMFPEGTNVVSSSKEQPTFLHHAAEMYKQGVRHLHMIAGSDRVKEYEEKLNKYNDGKDYPHGKYKFKSITVHSSGERDPDAEGVEGMSASKMRELASSGKKKEFHEGLPAKMKKEHKEEMYNDVRKGMGLK